MAPSASRSSQPAMHPAIHAVPDPATLTKDEYRQLLQTLSEGSVN